MSLGTTAGIIVDKNSAVQDVQIIGNAIIDERDHDSNADGTVDDIDGDGTIAASDQRGMEVGIRLGRDTDPYPQYALVALNTVKYAITAGYQSVSSGTAGRRVWGNTWNAADEGAVLGAGTDADICIKFDQGTGTDPMMCWDDSAARQEWDFDGVLGDGADPYCTTDRIIAPTYLGITSGSYTALIGARTQTGSRIFYLPASPNSMNIFVTGDSSMGGVLYSPATAGTHDTGTLACGITGLTCKTTYAPAGTNQACSYDWNTGTATPFYAVCQ